MVIQHNMAAVFTQYQVDITGRSKAKSMEKLSTGYKINRAADNAAGLSISEKLRAQIRGLSRSQENIQDGISYCNVADGALSEVHNMLDRLKELAVQSANDTYSDEDRKNIDKEVQQLKAEMNSTFENTNFNTINIWQASYIPDVGGECQDFSLYNVQDSTGSYYGGISYMNHRYSWEDLGITNWDSSSHLFTSTEEFRIDAARLQNNGQNPTNDFSTPNDDYLSKASGGAVFTIQTAVNSRAIDIEKNYRWSADDQGIYIDDVLTDGTNSGSGNTTWAAMGLTAGQDVPGGTYSFNYYGMNVSFDVPAEGASWTSFLGGFNNPLINIDWHSRYFTSVSEEVADITASSSTITINSSNKDYISADPTAYTIFADTDGIWMENSSSAAQSLTKDSSNQTLTRWEDISNLQGYDINSWGMDTGGDASSNVNSTTGEDGGDRYVTFSSDAQYIYANSLLGGSSSFSFTIALADDASRNAIITDINNSTYHNLGIISPSKVSAYTSGSSGFPSTAISTNLSFLTQRDLLNRGFNSNTEVYANGALSAAAGNYNVTLSGTGGGTCVMTSTESSSSLESRISTDITNRMLNMYLPVKASSSAVAQLSDISDPTTNLGLGTYNLTFQNGSDNLSLQLDLSNVRYGDIISSTDSSILGIAPDTGSFAAKLNSYITDKMSNFLSSTFSISGDGATYQQLGLQEEALAEASAVNVPVVDGFKVSLMIQAGAGSNDGIGLEYDYLRLGSLGIKSLDVLTSTSADSALRSIDGAIEKVSRQRSLFGAYTNRLQHAKDLNANSEENMQNAESIIRDTDMAAEIAAYSKHNILEQVGQSMLAQANKNVNSVLTLLQ